ncbi:MAG TPA: hypothetical protein VGL56_02705 [Fimbriimonadaceae bacterium]
MSIWAQCAIGGGFGALYSILSDFIIGNHIRIAPAVCQTAGGCIAAILGAIVGTALAASGVGAALAGCIDGLIASAVSALANWLCSLLSQTRSRVLWYCMLISIVVGTVLGCAGGNLAEDTIKHDIEEGVISLLSSLGFQVSLQVCNFAGS